MFSQLLFSHRRRRALSQEDLARRAGLTARSIRNLECGSVRTPRPGTVRRLADGLALDGADRERFESAAVATYLGERETEPRPAGVPARPRFVVTEGFVTTPGGGLTVRWTQDEPAAGPDTEFCVTIRGFTAPQTARRPADLLRAVLDALGAHAHDIPVAPDPTSGVDAVVADAVASAGVGVPPSESAGPVGRAPVEVAQAGMEVAGRS